jgi:hypothetical protein
VLGLGHNFSEKKLAGPIFRKYNLQHPISVRRLLAAVVCFYAPLILKFLVVCFYRS